MSTRSGHSLAARLLQAAPLAVVMVATWVLLQGEVTLGNVLGGALLAVLLLAAFPLFHNHVTHRVHPWGAVKFVGFVVWSLMLSSWAVIKTIVRPTDENLRSGIVRIRLEQESPLTSTLVANAITLTPGTMTLTSRLDPAELSVHVLGLGDPDEFRASVHDLERRVLEAVTPQYADDRPPEDPS